MFSLLFLSMACYVKTEKILSLFLNLVFENVTQFKIPSVFGGLPENHTFTKCGCTFTREIPHYIFTV